MTEQPSREKFATQMDSAMLADLRALAKTEGRQLQSLVEEAVGNLIADRALTMYLDGIVVSGNLTSRGGGAGLKVTQQSPFYNFPIKDDTVAGHLAVTGWRGGWACALATGLALMRGGDADGGVWFDPAQAVGDNLRAGKEAIADFDEAAFVNAHINRRLPRNRLPALMHDLIDVALIAFGLHRRFWNGHRGALAVFDGDVHQHARDQQIVRVRKLGTRANSVRVGIDAAVDERDMALDSLIGVGIGPRDDRRANFERRQETIGDVKVDAHGCCVIERDDGGAGADQRSWRDIGHS